MNLKGKIVHAFHDITSRYSELKIEINEIIYQTDIQNYPRKGNLYEIEDLEIMLEGDLDEESKRIVNPKNIWIRLL